MSEEAIFYYQGLIEKWQKRLDEIEACKNPEEASRFEGEVLEEIIFEVSLGLAL